MFTIEAISKEINPFCQYETKKRVFDGKRVEKYRIIKVVIIGLKNKINLFIIFFLFLYNSTIKNAKITNNDGNDNSTANDKIRLKKIIF